MKSPTPSPELLHATELYRAGAYATASQALDAALADNTDDPAALSLQGLCRVRLGETVAGLALLARAGTVAPHDGEIVLRFGIGLMAAGHTADAATLFRRATTMLPENPAPWLNLAAALLAQGKLAEARVAARKARLRAPDRAEVHYTLGLIDAAADALEPAAAAFARATKLAPGFAEAWLNLGVTRYRLNNLDGARAALRQALAVRPGYPAAAANLAALDRVDGLAEQSRQQLEFILAEHPNSHEARINLAVTLIGEEHDEEALALLDGAPPNDRIVAAHWHLQRATAMLHLGRTEAACAVLDSLEPVPPVLMPLLRYRRLLVALDGGDTDGARSLADTMEGELRGIAGVLPEHRVIGWHDLGWFWDRVGEPDRAFDARIEAHRALGRLQPFSRDHYAAFMHATVAAFDRARLHDGPRAANRDPAPVFIVGMPRSGTTLVEHILAAHPAVHGAGERTALADLYASLAGSREEPDGPARIAALDAATLDEAAEGYLAGLHALAPGKARIVDKMPANFRYLGLAALLLPGARVIACERDPRDIGLSIFQFRFFGYHPYAHELGDLGWYIARQRQLMAHWRAVLPIPLLTLPMRDWVDDFDATLRRVLAFLDLPYDAACERFHEQDREILTVSRFQVREPVNDRGLDRWRRCAHRLQPLIAELDAGGIVLDEDSQAASGK